MVSAAEKKRLLDMFWAKVGDIWSVQVH